MEVYISIAALTASLFVIIAVIFREKSTSSKIVLLENAIEDLNQQNHKLTKIFKERSFEEDINKIVEERITFLIDSFDDVKKFASEYGMQKETSEKAMDCEKSVLRLYEEGKNESEIGDILGLSVNQVELILTLNNPQ